MQCRQAGDMQNPQKCAAMSAQRARVLRLKGRIVAAPETLAKSDKETHGAPCIHWTWASSLLGGRDPMRTIGAGVQEGEGKWRKNQIGDEIHALDIRPDIGGSGLEKLCVEQMVLMLAVTGIQEKKLLRQTVVVKGRLGLLVPKSDRGMIHRPVDIHLVHTRKRLSCRNNGGVNAGLGQPQNTHHQRDGALCVCGAEKPEHDWSNS